MKCFAIGDMFIPARYFDEVLQESGLFEEYHSTSWKEEEDKKQARDTIRKIETLGSKAFPLSEEMKTGIKEAEVVFIHLCPIPAELIEQSDTLKYIITARGGVENIDVEAAGKKGITIINCPAHNAYAVAEYTIGLMLCEMRNIARANKSLISWKWREEYPNSAAIPELRGSKIGIVGFGTIGRLVAERAAVFGSEVLVYDPFVPDEDIRKNGYQPCSIIELLEEADVVTLHGRIGAGDPPIIAKRELQIMKKTAYLINTARAVLVDMDALYYALKNQEIMGAAIDVFPVEPLPADYPFYGLDNVTITNHRGGATINSYIKAPEMLLNQFRNILKQRM